MPQVLVNKAARKIVIRRQAADDDQITVRVCDGGDERCPRIKQSADDAAATAKTAAAAAAEGSRVVDHSQRRRDMLSDDGVARATPKLTASSSEADAETDTSTSDNSSDDDGWKALATKERALRALDRLKALDFTTRGRLDASYGDRATGVESKTGFGSGGDGGAPRAWKDGQHQLPPLSTHDLDEYGAESRWKDGSGRTTSNATAPTARDRELRRRESATTTPRDVHPPPFYDRHCRRPPPPHHVFHHLRHFGGERYRRGGGGGGFRRFPLPAPPSSTPFVVVGPPTPAPPPVPRFRAPMLPCDNASPVAAPSNFIPPCFRPAPPVDDEGGVQRLHDLGVGGGGGISTQGLGRAPPPGIGAAPVPVPVVLVVAKRSAEAGSAQLPESQFDWDKLESLHITERDLDSSSISQLKTIAEHILTRQVALRDSRLLLADQLRNLKNAIENGEKSLEEARKNLKKPKQDDEGSESPSASNRSFARKARVKRKYESKLIGPLSEEAKCNAAMISGKIIEDAKQRQKSIVAASAVQLNVTTSEHASATPQLAAFNVLQPPPTCSSLVSAFIGGMISELSDFRRCNGEAATDGLSEKRCAL